MGTQSWAKGPNPSPLLARFVPNCAKLVSWVQSTGQAPTRSRSKDRPTNVGTSLCAGQRPVCNKARADCTVGGMRPPRANCTDIPCGSNFELNCPFGSWLPPYAGCLVLPGPSLPRPNLAKPTAFCTVAPKSFGTNFCVLHSSRPIGRSPNSISLFLTCALCTVALHGRWPQYRVLCAGGSGQLALTTGQRRLGPAYCPLPSHKGRAKRGRTGGWDAREACGPAERPRCGHAH